MSLHFRRWYSMVLLASCLPLAVLGPVFGDDEAQPAATGSESTGTPSGTRNQGDAPERGRFREALQQRLGGDSGMRPDPDRIVAMLMDRFDEDKDQKLNADELKKALGAFRNMGGMLGQGPEGMPPGGAGPGGMGPQFIARLFEMNDKDRDGKLTGDEIPERMRQALDRVDRNGDGAVDKAEAEEMAARMASGQRPGGGREGNTPSETRVPRRPPSE